MSRGPATFAASCILVAIALIPSPASGDPGVRVQVVRFVDHTRRAVYRTGISTPRVLMTSVRSPRRRRGHLPLIVFAHGFALTPATYRRLLDAWVRAGYVVAAPIFPVEGATAPGGPSQSDLLNEPLDLRFLISRLTAPRSRFRSIADPAKVAVVGQSDGAVAAFSLAYDPRYRDRRIDAAVVMSGGPLVGFTAAARGSPPLLAVQGTADPLNPAGVTAAYFRLMRRPKFLLWLLGASHLPPYTTNDRWASAVTRTTIAFLDHYLKRAPLRAITSNGSRAGVTRLWASP